MKDVLNVFTWLRGVSPAVLIACAIVLVLLAAGAADYASHVRRGREKTIRIATALLPPHMNERGEGREADIIRAALKRAGINERVDFFILPFTRHWAAYQRDNRFDAVTTVPDRLQSSAVSGAGSLEPAAAGALRFDGFLTKVYVQYENGVVYRTAAFGDGLGPKPLTSLAGKRVVAFAGASAILPELREAVSGFAFYAERDDQYEHSVMLSRERVDAVIADRLIVDHYNREVNGAAYATISDTLAFDTIYCPTNYRLVFRQDALRQAFDRGLELLRESGELEEINKRYRENSGLRLSSRTLGPCE